MPCQLWSHTHTHTQKYRHTHIGTHKTIFGVEESIDAWMGDTFPTGNVIEDPDQLWCVECCEKIANEKCFQTVSQVISFLCNEEHEQLNTIIINAITKPKKKKTQQPPKTSMSSNILHSSKNYRKDWVSQFGLYRLVFVYFRIFSIRFICACVCVHP